jgi:acyl transferase domain-containing protein/NADPH:quinone reductase-like Zn-dependent oxidoreductase/short-subunit dehydrogenase/acyl carrier protein
MTSQPIALIGAACRFPGAADLAEFAELLAEGRDAVSEIPAERWARGLFYHPERGQPGKSYTYAAGTLASVDQFDPMFFGISPREAVQMDPQQRLLLELTHEAIEDAGIDGSRLTGRPIGVYIGGSSSDYMTMRLGDPAGADAYFMTGSTLCSLANRISYVFDLRGPSFTVDTACSSSLVALHLACEALRAGEIEAAVVGGVNLLLAPQSYVGFARASMLSPRGRCHAFDERADGYVRAEGGGVVLLRRLNDAVAAGDMVRAVIRATGVNSDGRTTGFSLPNKAAQIALLQEVYTRCEVSADDLVYLEAHGTGTPVGDPIEAAAIGAVLGQRRATPLPVGSVKTNLGHLEPASGMAGLLKVMLTLEQGVIPRSLHCETPNPAIPFEDLNLRLVPERLKFARARRPAAAAVNSFGFGGTNAHAVLTAIETQPIMAETVDDAAGLPPLLLSARAEGALRELVLAWRQRLAKTPVDRLAPALRGLARGREQHPVRLVVAGANRAELIAGLDAYLHAREHPALITGTSAGPGELVFVFAGNGSQWAGMGAEALRLNPDFARGLALVDAELASLLGWSVLEYLGAEPDEAGLRRTEIAQPLLFAVQVASVLALRARGITPSIQIGHSAGEVAAAWSAGVLTLAQAARVIAARSHRQQATHGQGGMAALGLSETAARALIAEIEGIEIAAVNGANSVTMAGTSSGMAELAARAAARSLSFTRLDLDYAFHSAAMDPIEAPLLADLADLGPAASAGRSAGDPFISTVTGGPLPAGELTPAYWWRNVRAPVRFADAVRAAIEQGGRVFLEIGPQPVLLSYVNDALRTTDTPGRALASLTRRAAGRDPFALIAARCHAAGVSIAGTAVFNGQAMRRNLPAYPWQRERYWIARTVEASDVATAPLDHPLLGYRRGVAPEAWFNHLSVATETWLADHVVDRSVVLPAAAIIDLAFAAARQRHPQATSLDVRDLEIHRPLVLEGVSEVAFRATDAGGFELTSRKRLSDDPWTLHASGRLAAGDTSIACVAPVAGPPVQTMAATELYALAQQLGLAYGPQFRTVTAIALVSDDAAIVSLMRPPMERNMGERHRHGYLIDPALLDGAMQGLVALAARRLGALRDQKAAQFAVMPWRFGRARLLRPVGALAHSAELRITRAGPRSVCAEIAVRDAAGATIAELTDAWFVAVPIGRVGEVSERVFRVDHLTTADGRVPVPQSVQAALATVTTKAGAEPPEPLVLAEAYATERAYAALAGLAGTAVAFTTTHLVAAGALHPSSQALADGMLTWLEADGLAVAGPDGWVLSDDADLPPATELWRSLLFDTPAGVAETALLGLTGEALADTLRRGEPAELSEALLDQMLTASPAAAAAIEALTNAVAAVAASWPPHRPLRILEIGARRGALTRRVLQCLTDQTQLRYVALTLSPDDLPSLVQTTAGYGGATAGLWREGEDGIAPAAYDMIIGLYPMTMLDTIDPAALQAGLAAGGMFLCVEPAPNRLWGMILGSHQTWWVRRPTRVDMKLRSGADWRLVLTEAGFVGADMRVLASPTWPVALIGALRDRSWVEPPAPPLVVTPVVLFNEGIDELAEGLEVALLEAARPVQRQHISQFPSPSADSASLAHEKVLLIAPAEHDEAAAAAVCAAVLERIAAATANLAVSPPLRLWLVTRAEALGSPLGAALTGLRRVLANEAPDLDCRLLLISPQLDDARAIAGAAAEILRPDAETEICLTPAGRSVPRIRRGLRGNLAARQAQAANRACLQVARPGLLDTLSWVARPEPAAARADDEVAIEVRAAGLNFRDVMWAMGLLPDEALMHGFAGPSLGLECAGVVRAVGPDVHDLRPGDRVMGFAPSSLATDVVTARHAVLPMPDGLGFAEAATIPVAFLTVAYALDHLAHLAPGERVLIHGAAGGVGLAAIQLAHARGAVVFATAGSPVKRNLLRLLGVDHVLDSRSLAFADEVMALTGGEGVDVVLNSLSGEAMERSLSLLRPFGRFLELGKRDLYRNTAVGIRPMRHNVSYFAIDADQLPLHRPALARSLFAQIAALFGQGALRPLPHRVFAFDAASEAFRLMQSAGHIGKIILTPGRTPLRLAAPRPDFVARADRTYVLTGALSGFGLETAYWLAQHGARHLALLGRRGAATPGATAAMARLAAQGVAVRAYACDVADEAALATVLAAIRTAMPPICGVVHAAMVLDDALLPHLDHARFAGVMAPKFTGAALLDRLTRPDPIELFLLFSSVTTALGNPGQANYVAANAALEAIAQRRNMEGLPALAVAWGPIGDTGTLARQSDVSEALLRRLGSAHLRAAEALDALPALLADGHPVLGYADLRWGAARQQLPLLNAALFSEVIDLRGADTAEVDLRALLAERSPEEARALVLGLLVEEVAGILKLAAERVDPTRPLAELGMDSLMAVELRLSVESRVGVNLPLLSLSDGATLSSMAARVVRSLGDQPGETENVIDLLTRFEPTEDPPAMTKPVARTAL